jgi:hypothetical protein
MSTTVTNEPSMTVKTTREETLENELRACHERVREVSEWKDVDDEWTDAIKAAHPARSGAHDEYATAMKMVGHRHSKGELVALVTWLLVQRDTLLGTLARYADCGSDGRRAGAYSNGSIFLDDGQRARNALDSVDPDWMGRVKREAIP